MSQLKQPLLTFFKAVAAGIMISIGGCVFLSSGNRIAGAVLFAVGLYAICAHRLNLYTGKIGYLAEKKKGEVLPYLRDLLLIWLGNFTGCILSGLAVNATRIGAGLSEAAAALTAPKLSDGLFSLFLLGIFCGILMYAAVEGYKLTKNPLILFACVAAFILSGFEHCVADMFYFAAAGDYTLWMLLCTVVITLGNSAGGMLVPAIVRAFTPKES
ncbi:MAG: formate/nitrite transporter family protein [Lachnospiraceae bacterium]|nr:formate/nitrite transporter family protein [Lachnospiraceae bacterium]